MSAPETVARPRGRPRQFDRDDVLHRVTELFWEKGFEATSVADIVEATDLNKSSLYNAFGSKEDLFILALERYLEMRVSMMAEALTTGTEGLSDVVRFLAYMEEETTRGTGNPGCLAVNTSAEFGGRDEDMIKMSLGYRNQVRGAMRAALGRAEAAGEIAEGSVDRHVAMLLSFVLSIAVISRSGAGGAELEGQFAAARAMIEDWRVDH